MGTPELEQVIDDLRTITNCLAQLRYMDGTTMHTPESIAVFYKEAVMPDKKRTRSCNISVLNFV